MDPRLPQQLRKPLQFPLVYLAVTFCLSGLARADTYRFITLDMPGYSATTVRGIDNNGDVVGSAMQAGNTIGFLYSGGAFTPIAVPGAASTTAAGIDNSGRIVGFYTLAGNSRVHGFLYDGGSYSTIDAPGAETTEALALNDDGDVVGSFRDAQGLHGFLKEGENFTRVDAPGAVSTTASGINSAGVVVGTFIDSQSRTHGFLYAGGKFSTLDAPDGQSPRTLSINDAGLIVGFPGFLYRDGHFSAIDASGAPGPMRQGAIDNTERLAGSYVDAGGVTHGFLATPLTRPVTESSGTISTARPTAVSWNRPSLTAKTSASGGVCDVNNNGSVNATDVQQMIREALGLASPANNLNSDHVVNVTDIQVVANAALLRGCTPVAGQPGGTVAHLTVQSGQGQVLCILPSCTLQSWQPLSVKATDGAGNPVTGATVSWTVTNGQIMLGSLPGTTSATSVTGSDGIATQTLSESVFVWTANPYFSFNVNSIQATSNNVSVTFTETQSLENPSAGSSEIQANPPQFGNSGLGDAPLSAPSGTTLSTPIQERVSGLDQASNGVGNISVRIINQQSSPALTCVTGTNADPGSVLTDAQGNSSCYPIFSGSGSGSYYVVIGGVAGGSIGNGALYFSALGPLFFTSATGPAATVQIVSGNNQTVPVSQPLSPLIAKVVDSQGFPIVGQAVVWSVSPPTAATLGLGGTQTDGNGEVSIAVSLRSTCASGCSITVAVQGNPSLSATFHASLP